MKKINLTKWGVPLLFILLFILCIRIANDITWNVHYLEGNTVTFIMNDTVSIIIAGYFCYFFLRYWLKVNLKRKRGWLFEYGILALFTVLFCLATMYVSWNINGRMYTIKDVAIPGTIVELFVFWVYTLLRNQSVQHENDMQHIQIEKIKNDKLDTELKFLKAQYHPHFLFNALNTIYFQIDEKNEAPLRTIETLSDLLRYQIYNDGDKIEIQEEISYLNQYISLCKLRASERLHLDTHFDDNLKQQKVYPMLFVPLVENAFKYVGGDDYEISLDMSLVRDEIRFYIENSVAGQKILQTVADNKLDALKAVASQKKHGVGLENLRRRLDLLYHDRYTLNIEQEADKYKAELFISL